MRIVEKYKDLAQNVYYLYQIEEDINNNRMKVTVKKSERIL